MVVFELQILLQLIELIDSIYRHRLSNNYRKAVLALIWKYYFAYIDLFN